MKHDLVWHTDADGPYQKCRVCGRIIGVNETLGGLLKPSECTSASTTRKTIDPQWQQMMKGLFLINRWKNERGEE